MKTAMMAKRDLASRPVRVVKVNGWLFALICGAIMGQAEASIVVQNADLTTVTNPTYGTCQQYFYKLTGADTYAGKWQTDVDSRSGFAQGFESGSDLAFIYAMDGSTHAEFTYKFDFRQTGNKLVAAQIYDGFAVFQDGTTTSSYYSVNGTDRVSILDHITTGSGGDYFGSQTNPVIDLTALATAQTFYWKVTMDNASGFVAPQDQFNRLWSVSTWEYSGVRTLLVPVPEPAALGLLLGGCCW